MSPRELLLGLLSGLLRSLLEHQVALLALLLALVPLALGLLSYLLALLLPALLLRLLLPALLRLLELLLWLLLVLPALLRLLELLLWLSRLLLLRLLELLLGLLPALLLRLLHLALLGLAVGRLEPLGDLLGGHARRALRIGPSRLLRRQADLVVELALPLFTLWPLARGLAVTGVGQPLICAAAQGAREAALHLSLLAVLLLSSLSLLAVLVRGTLIAHSELDTACRRRARKRSSEIHSREGWFLDPTINKQ
jgi:hypothetical protein